MTSSCVPMPAEAVQAAGGGWAKLLGPAGAATFTARFNNGSAVVDPVRFSNGVVDLAHLDLMRWAGRFGGAFTTLVPVRLKFTAANMGLWAALRRRTRQFASKKVHDPLQAYEGHLLGLAALALFDGDIPTPTSLLIAHHIERDGRGRQETVSIQDGGSLRKVFSNFHNSDGPGSVPLPPFPIGVRTWLAGTRRMEALFNLSIRSARDKLMIGAAGANATRWQRQ